MRGLVGIIMSTLVVWKEVGLSAIVINVVSGEAGSIVAFNVITIAFGGQVWAAVYL